MNPITKMFLRNAIRIVTLLATAESAYLLGTSTNHYERIAAPPVALLGGFASGRLVNSFDKYVARKNDETLKI